MASGKYINKTFNTALFFYLLLSSTIEHLFDTSSDKSVPWDRVYEWSPSIAVSGALLLVLVLAILGAIIAKIFWNRFVADIFKVREITYDESLAIVLIIAIISA